jgi:hypothetical protein
MPTKQTLIQSLQRTAQELRDEDLIELQRFADYLINTQPKDGARLSIHELPSQHQQASVLISYVLQRSHLISMVNHLANIILHAETLSPSDKLEAQEAIKKASWIQ